MPTAQPSSPYMPPPARHARERARRYGGTRRAPLRRRAPPRSEDECLAAARRGDREAQGQLFRRHARRVTRTILRVTRDESGVEDLVHEVFIRAFNSVRRFRGDARIETWLHVIAVNLARTWLDREARRRRRDAFAVTRAHEEPLSPDEHVERALHRERLHTVIATLPKIFRDAFIARAVDGLSLREASRRLGVGVSTVSFRAQRGEQLVCAALGLEWVSPRRRRAQPAT